LELVEIVLPAGGVFTFDGRVFEYFGSFGLGGGHSVSSVRIHRSQLKVKTKGPDRKGRYELTFVSPAPFDVTWPCDDEAELRLFDPILDALRQAGVTFES